ncbi:aldo/keto reductase [Halobacterium salinarum]|nr:aldo/keto reductase [Halobacterium salinarum]MCF2167854.1 aldo/keto reductase [Halobacterium salinarum]MCF2207689.1 aldo/keto reductase [Halobacterium salinarum]MCF2239317.1 aldo/keto reductase [Halobacterium salinarum]QRY23776.1 aldo/keto reductase [Halobacterium sp. GSL-19]
MPEFGLGTWENEDPSACADSVRTALEMGYRHIDTAQIYENEDAVGDGIAAADVDREDVFLATKVWTSELGDGDVAPATEQSLEKLGVDYVDLLYVHWPANQYDATETLAALADLQADGVTERIGVSNFEPRHLDEAEDVLGELPFANQVEFHPLLQQEELREYADGEDIELVAYSPLARGEVFDVPEIQAVAEKHGVSEAQVSLAWVRRKGVTAIPKATGEDHIADNWASLDLELDDEDVAKIDGIDRRERQVDPEFGPWN